MDTSTDAEISTDPVTLTFTTGNWSSAQTVTVTAINDLVDEGAHTGDYVSHLKSQPKSTRPLYRLSTQVRR
jgi:hypothetical protein